MYAIWDVDNMEWYSDQVGEGGNDAIAVFKEYAEAVSFQIYTFKTESIDRDFEIRSVTIQEKE